MSGGDRMETLREAIARLERQGYVGEFVARPGGLLECGCEGAVAPETLIVDEVVRFEGTSDPQDEAVLLALRARDGSVAGTFLTRYGPQAGPDDAAALQRLDTRQARRG